jgi:epoxyqueuosine reductase
VSLSQAIKNEAHRLGFTLAGITTAEPPPHFETYTHWLALGWNGSMGYLAGERAIGRRRDPRLILPDCRSILVLGVRYPDPASASQSTGSSPTGLVAAYAWGQDYHLVLPERLKALVDFVEEQTGQPVPNRVYTDTGPLLERELAQRAGLGWIGKNTCLIHPRLGSYFLLAEVMLGVDLEPDPPFTDDRCGTCTRCIQACPTGCILPDRTLDAERCISYLTIENRGSIPADLRPLMGRWVFGCDICQLVCPWNRFATADHDPAFAAEPGMSSPDLEEELGLSRQEFNRKFKRSPVIRTRWAGYLRNVAIAMGNAGSPQSIPALEAALQIDEPLIHEQLLWAIEQLRSKQ